MAPASSVVAAHTRGPLPGKDPRFRYPPRASVHRSLPAGRPRSRRRRFLREKSPAKPPSTLTTGEGNHGSFFMGRRGGWVVVRRETVVGGKVARASPFLAPAPLRNPRVPLGFGFVSFRLSHQASFSLRTTMRRRRSAAYGDILPFSRARFVPPAGRSAFSHTARVARSVLIRTSIERPLVAGISTVRPAGIFRGRLEAPKFPRSTTDSPLPSRRCPHA